MSDQEQADIRLEFSRLKQEHADFDAAINAMIATNCDPLQIQRMKKKKLVSSVSHSDSFCGLTSWATSGCEAMRLSMLPSDSQSLWNLAPLVSVPWRVPSFSRVILITTG